MRRPSTVVTSMICVSRDSILHCFKLKRNARGRPGLKSFFLMTISNHSYLVYTIDVSVILSEARRA